MNRPFPRQTHTFATMEVSDSAYDEIRKNFTDLGPSYIHEYIQDFDGDEEVIALGPIGLIRKQPAAIQRPKPNCPYCDGDGVTGGMDGRVCLCMK